VSRRSIDDGIVGARLQGAAIRLVHAGTAEAGAVRELVQLAGGGADLLTAQGRGVAAFRRRSPVVERTCGRHRRGPTARRRSTASRSPAAPAPRIAPRTCHSRRDPQARRAR
jgi:hypothetical protein